MKFADTLESSIQGFTFSAVRPDALGAVEYTLVTLVLDKTGSVAGFQNDLFQIKSSVVNACKRSPRADYVLLRVVEFNSYVDEVHGFQPLADIDPTSYQVPHCSGSTALNDLQRCHRDQCLRQNPVRQGLPDQRAVDCGYRRRRQRQPNAAGRCQEGVAIGRAK